MSIIEVMVALVVMSIMALSVAHFSHTKTQSSQSENLDAFNCQIQVNSVLSTLRGEGQSSSMLSYYPHLGYNLLNGVPTGNPEQDYAIERSDVWRGPAPAFMPANFNAQGRRYVLMDASQPGQLPIVHMAPLQRSIVNLLEELYNTQPAFCGNSEGHTTPELQAIAERYSYMARRPLDEDSAIDVASTTFRQNTQTQFKITPYELDSGRLLTSCPARLGSIPMGIDMNRSSFVSSTNPNGIVRPVSPNQTNIGYQLEVITTVRDNRSNDVVGRCSGSQRFEHQRDSLPPRRPVVHAVVMNSTYSNFNINSTDPVGFGANRRNVGDIVGSIDAGSAGRNEVQVAFRMENVKRGNLMLCRDRSLVPVSHPLDEASGSVCMGAQVSGGQVIRPGPGPQRFSGGQPPAMRTPTDTSGMQLLSDALGQSSTWVPCDQVTLCGRRPIESRLTGAGAQSSTPNASVTANRASLGLDANRDGLIDEVSFYNRYENLRSECVANLEIATTDQSGNIDMASMQTLTKFPREAALGNTTGLAPAPSTSDYGSAFTEIARPTCGPYFCEASPDAMQVFFPGTGTQGYWQSTQCCTVIEAGDALGRENLARDPAQAQTVDTYNRTYACQPGYRPSMGPGDSSPPRLWAISTDDLGGRPEPFIAQLDSPRGVSPMVSAEGATLSTEQMNINLGSWVTSTRYLQMSFAPFLPGASVPDGFQSQPPFAMPGGVSPGAGPTPFLPGALPIDPTTNRMMGM